MTTNPTPPLSEAGLAAVLGEHRWTWRVFQQRPEMVCTCGDRLIPAHSSGVAGLDDHDAHVAAVLAPLLAADREQAGRDALVGAGLSEADADILRETVFRLAADITFIKRVCTQEHPPKMASPTPDWEPGTETRHSDGTRCVLLHDGDWAILPTRDRAEESS